MRILHRRSGAALALVALSTTLGSMAVANPASAAGRADLTVGLTVDRSRIPVQGEVVKTDIKVANAGFATADDITVTVDLPTNAYVAGEGPLLDSWQCSALSPRMVCTHAALAPGQSADPFTFGIQFRAGTDGQTGEITATVTSASRESSTRNNSAEQSVTYDASVTYPDLYVSSVAPLSYEVIEGDWVKYPMRFSNRGSGTAQDVRVRVVAPAGPLGGVGNQSDPSWQCTTMVTDQEWECVNGPLAPGEQTPVLSFSGPVPAGGQPGDQLPVSITVSTSTPGENPRGNTYEAAFVYVTPAYLTGRIWLDEDADGQRDPEEGVAPTGELGLSVQPYEGATRSITVNADGTYRLALHEGQHQLLASLVSTTHRFTTPQVGDDATDSDVFVTYDSLEQQEAQSEQVFLAQGDETILDIGLVSIG